MTTNISVAALGANFSQIPSSFVVYDNAFYGIIGPAPKLEVLLENDLPLFHEASVFTPTINELFVTSNFFNDTITKQKTIQITKISLPENDGSTNDYPTQSITYSKVDTAIPMPNGGVNYGSDHILFCGQGNMTATGGLFKTAIHPPYTAELLVGSFYGRQFTSVNDVVIHSDGTIWFTDPIYGYEQGFRPFPKLPSQVYRFDPRTDNVRVVADGFGRPNGISFSPDEKILYITDTAFIIGDGTVNYTNPSTIYAFDITIINGETFLTNRRVFAMADTGVPDGIKQDTLGNVYSGCGDGINVWSAGGVLLGKILVPNGVANFAFGRNGELFLLNEHRLWRAQLGYWVKGALLGI